MDLSESHRLLLAYNNSDIASVNTYTFALHQTRRSNDV